MAYSYEFFTNSSTHTPYNGLIEVKQMKYKTVALPYEPRAEKMAIQTQNTVNEFAKKGWKVVSCSITPSAHAILILEEVTAE